MSKPTKALTIQVDDFDRKCLDRLAEAYKTTRPFGVARLALRIGILFLERDVASNEDETEAVE